MKTSLPSGAIAALVMLGSILPAPAAEDSVVTAVFSSVGNGYVRSVNPDGSCKPEYYVMGNGGAMPGTVANSAGEDVAFPALVRLIAGHLAKENYLPAAQAGSADLLLILSWGKTVPFNDSAQRATTDSMFSAMTNLKSANEAVKASETESAMQRNPEGSQISRNLRAAASDALEGQLFQMQMFGSMRTKANEQNANLLGYTREINQQNNPTRFAGSGNYYDDLISDIENERYYLIISAYDYRFATQTKKSKLLWTTRVSIQAQGNRFRDGLATMLANAAPHFGQASGRLIRHYQRGTVKLGDLKVLETVPEAVPPAKPAGGK